MVRIRGALRIGRDRVEGNPLYPVLSVDLSGLFIQLLLRESLPGPGDQLRHDLIVDP